MSTLRLGVLGDGTSMMAWDLPKDVTHEVSYGVDDIVLDLTSPNGIHQLATIIGRRGRTVLPRTLLAGMLGINKGKVLYLATSAGGGKVRRLGRVVLSSVEVLRGASVALTTREGMVGAAVLSQDGGLIFQASGVIDSKILNGGAWAAVGHNRTRSDSPFALLSARNLVAR